MEGEFDRDLEGRSAEDLADEVRRLRAGIREHRDASGHELCWHHPQLWSLLPEQVEPAIRIPEWAEFLRRCVAYRQSLDLPPPGPPPAPPAPGEGVRGEESASFE